MSVLNPNKIVMISKSYCPFCVGAKNLLDGYGVKYDVYEADLGEISNDQVKEIQAKSNHRTFPSIWFGEKFIGGFTELKKYSNNQGFEQELSQYK